MAKVKQLYMKQYRKDHKERIRQYREDNKEKIAERIRQYEEDHKEERTDYHKQYRLDNKEYFVKYKKKYTEQWNKTPTGKLSKKASNHKRRLLTSDLAKETVQRVYEDNIKKYGTLTCVLCGKPVEFKDSSLEHLTPLSRGGTNDYDNLGIAHYICNCRKQTKTLEEWFKI